MSFVDSFRPKWRHSNPVVRADTIASITDRGTLELILESKAPPDVREIAAERLFADDHIRAHARTQVREAAVRVLRNQTLLRVIAENDSDPALRALATGRLGPLQTCGLCGQVAPAVQVRCECGFDLAAGDLALALAAGKAVRRRAKGTMVGGALLIGLGLLGGLRTFPIYLSIFLNLGGYHIDLLFVFGGCGLLIRGWRMHARPWMAINAKVASPDTKR